MVHIQTSLNSMYCGLRLRGSTYTQARAKQTAKDKGGDIKHEFSLIKGFTYAHTSPKPLY